MLKAKMAGKGRSKRDVQRVNEYLWKRCIEQSATPVGGLDDQQALSILEEWFEKHPLESNNDFFLYGFLLFELAFEDEDRKADYLARAKAILEKYRKHSGETDWEEIEDRLFDINSELDQMGLLTKVEAAGEVLIDPAKTVNTILDGSEKFPHIPDGMVLVPEGPFLYGPEKEERYLEAFLIDKVPVTNERYAEFLQEENYRRPKYWSDERFNQPDQPIVGISLMDARKFARWAGCELATDEQFEKAARGSDGRPYPWGTKIEADSTDFGQDPESGAARPVGSFPKNQSVYGALDLAGGVWEWTNTQHPSEESSRIIRGGSWCDPAEYMVIPEKMHASARERADNLGFRLVKNHP